MSENDLLKQNIVYDLIVLNTLKEYYDWKAL
jgi:hypothetical protein